MKNSTDFTHSHGRSGVEDNAPLNLDVLPEDDGRSKEWQDRARVNLEQVPEGTKTILERDFEPEQLNNEQEGSKNADANIPAY